MDLIEILERFDDEALRRLHLYQVRRVRFFPNRTFEFDRSGVPAGVLMATRSSGPDDFVAWPLHRPDKFAPRRRATFWPLIIGGDQIVPGEPIRVWRTPLEWLQNAATGVVIVQLDRCGLSYLPPQLHLIVQDDAHRAEIEKPLMFDYLEPPAITVTVAT